MPTTPPPVSETPPPRSSPSDPARPFYITTPIYYVNDRPHIGHCYSTLLADAVARFQRLVRTGAGPSDRVFLLTGTDEHADKVVTSAIEHGMTPQQWADLNAAQFKAAFECIGSTHDDFIRTTEPRHKEKVVAYIEALMRSGDIYKGDYTGWYDPGQEEYVTENAAREHDYKSEISGRPLVKRTEPCYFFRLGRHQTRLQELIETNAFRVAPESRKSEVLGRLRPPTVLLDVPISRPVTTDPATQWGIRVPGDDAHRVYVWIDALFNYLTVVDTPERRRFWPADVHLIGKDILWFHAVIWPALLIALKNADPAYNWVELPRCVFGHGWWVSEGQKMSKSLGNFIGLEKLQAYAARYSLDALRWYLITQGPLSGSDADFSHAKFVEVYNADLANGIGNCASRVSNMISKYFDGVLPAPESATEAASPLLDATGSKSIASWADATGRIVDSALQQLDRTYIGDAVQQGIALVRLVDMYINDTTPFKLAKTVETDPGAKRRLATILYQCAEALRVASLLLTPAMPSKMAELQRRWGCTPPDAVPFAELARFAHPRYALQPGTSLEIGEALFMRADAAEAAPD